MSLKAFRKFQISNVEGTVGTAEAAVERLPGLLTFESGEVIHWPQYDRNSLALYHDDDEIVAKAPKYTWSGDLNHRHANWLLAMAICGNVTPSQPSAVDQPLAYLWEYLLDQDGKNTPDATNGIDTFTLEYGDDDDAWETAFLFATRLQLQGGPDGVVTFSENLMGSGQEDSTFTAALSEVATQLFPFNLAEIYIDDTWAGLGSTQKTGLLRGFTWGLDTMFVPFPTADGSLKFGQLSESPKAPTLTPVFKWGTEAIAQRANYDTRDIVFIRLKFLGQTELDSGESNPPYLIIDGAYKYRTWPAWGEDEGYSTVQPELVGVEDPTSGKMLQASLYTNLSDWPA